MATHLVIVFDREVRALDLSTGTWSAHAVPTRANEEQSALGRGGSLVLSDGGNQVYVVDLVDGRGVHTIDDGSGGAGQLVGADDRYAWVRGYTPNGAEALRGWPLDGTDGVVTLRHGTDVWPMGVLAHGGVVFQAAELVVVVDDAGHEIVRTTGIVRAVVGDLVWVQRCSSIDRCTTTVFDPASGTSSDGVALGRFAWIDPRGDVAFEIGPDGWRAWTAVDGSLREVAGGAGYEPRIALDASGVTARSDRLPGEAGGRVMISAPGGRELPVRVPEAGTCCRGAQLLFVTLDND